MSNYLPPPSPLTLGERVEKCAALVQMTGAEYIARKNLPADTAAAIVFGHLVEDMMRSVRARLEKRGTWSPEVEANLRIYLERRWDGARADTITALIVAETRRHSPPPASSQSEPPSPVAPASAPAAEPEPPPSSVPVPQDAPPTSTLEEKAAPEASPAAEAPSAPVREPVAKDEAAYRDGLTRCEYYRRMLEAVPEEPDEFLQQVADEPPPPPGYRRVSYWSLLLKLPVAGSFAHAEDVADHFRHCGRERISDRAVREIEKRCRIYWLDPTHGGE